MASLMLRVPSQHSNFSLHRLIQPWVPLKRENGRRLCSFGGLGASLLSSEGNAQLMHLIPC